MPAITDIWFGSEQSKVEYSVLLGKVSDTSLELEARSHFGEKGEESTYLLDIQDGVATIEVKGPLIAFSNEYTQWLGITGYPDVRNAIVEAAQSDDAKEILLDIDSPGGAAKGLEDISALIERINAEFKPVTAYTSGMMTSAAYRIAASAGQIFTSKMAMVGSIGTTATHIEVTKALEMAGVTPRVFRSGEFKALDGPYEKLSETAANMIQHKIDSYNKEFVEYVARRRNVTPQFAEEIMGQGREFFGYEALDAKLIDGILSIDQINLKLRQSAQSKLSNTPRAVLASTAQTAINMESDMAKQKVLDDKTVAVIAAGGDPEAALENAPEVEEQSPDSIAETTETVEGVVEPSATSENTSLVDYLNTELSKARGTITQLTIDNRDLKTKAESMASTHDQLRNIAQDFTAIRSVALGRPRPDLSTLSDESLIQQFSQVTEEFHKVFPVGSKAASPSTEQPKSIVPGNHRSAVQASRI